jgi:hypothetical protein
VIANPARQDKLQIKTYRTMKRLYLIAVSLLCLTTFVSCNNDKDDLVEDGHELFKHCSMLKGFTDRDVDSVIEEIEDEGVLRYAGGSPLNMMVFRHFFVNDRNLITIMLYEDNENEIVFMAAELSNCTSKQENYKFFELYNSEPKYMLQGLDYDYYGIFIDKYGNESEFSCLDYFTNYYNMNKGDLLKCVSIWDTDLERISAIIEYNNDNDNDNYHPSLMYFNKTITPPSMLEGGIAKSLAESISKSLKK